MTDLQHLPSTYVRIGGEVRHALQQGVPVVALESAVITHGLPDPTNLAAARAMEAAVRAGGAVPATCLIQDGCLWIGASHEQAEAVARQPEREKASVRDLGAAIADRASAGLTVSATLFAAHLAGIGVFATGGIGGVHRDAAETGDISADLAQLARIPVITVCSGAKSVLDIPRTLELLETLGVPVYTYRSGGFPAFYLTSSGLTTPVMPSPADIARAARVQWDLGHGAGMVIGNPVPSPAAIDPEAWQTWLEAAESAARREGVRGKEVTPYLLARVAELSGGRTVRANLALLESNAGLAAEIAVALAG